MRLPVGIQTFEEIRKNGYIYADKTKEAVALASTYKYAFLARPRRFGKSLFLDTLKCLFEGRRELFEGLYAYDNWDWSKKYPVIKISWAGDLQTLEGVKTRAFDIFKENQKNLAIECENRTNPSSCFDELIKKAYKRYNQKVVILIDEYDKPILDVIDNFEQAKKHREFLKGLYSILKENDPYIRFAFLTGVSKFSKASIFSGLNMLSDISLLPRFGNICGFTQEEVEKNFKEYLADVDLQELKEWYNGYYFLKDKVYNPFDLLQFLQNKIYRNYWFSSGNPSFLIKLLQKKNYYLPKLSNLVVDEKLLDVFGIERIDIEVLLYQAGYLTINEVYRKRRRVEYRLYFPNYEVKSSFFDYLIDYLYDFDSTTKLQIQDNIYEALLQKDLQTFIDELKRLFASIPYNNLTHIKNYEGFYASIVFTFLQSLGFDIRGEDVTNKGRIDLSIFVEDRVYILEFKVTDKECEALKQIKEKRYYEKYKDKEVVLVGICFDAEERNIVNWQEERI